MTQGRYGLGTTLVIVAVVIIIVVGTIGFIILTSQPVPPSVASTSAKSSTSSTSSTGLSASHSTVSADDLQLQVTLNSSSISSRGEVAVQVELLNLQSQNVTMTIIPNQNISGWNGEDFFCSENPSHSLVGFTLFSGRFTAGNVSLAGSPLQLAGSSVEIPCPYALPLNSTTFLPDSDKTISFSYYGHTEEPPYLVTAEVNATTGYCSFSSSLSGECKGTSGILGYWNAGFGDVGNSSLGSKDFTYLPPGEYTIVAMDDWGQTVYAHFRVTSSIVTGPTVNSTTSGGPTQTATSATGSKDNLQLQLSLNTSSSSVSVFVDEYNPLGTTNNVTAEDSETANGNWTVRIGNLDGAPCWSDDWPLGFAIASGHYTSANITTAKFLDLVNPAVTYNCPLYVGYGTPRGYLFQPFSDTATTYGCIGTPCLAGSVATGRTSSSWGAVTGYWDQGGVFVSFPRGTYTVLAEDEWGNSVFAYFTIS